MRPRTIEWLVAGAVVVACCLLAFQRYEIVNDDAYITFAYAKNFAEGHGLVFRPDERVLGTTTPLWAGLLGIASRTTGLSVPAVARFAIILCLALSALLLTQLLASEELPFVGACLAPPLFFGLSVHWAVGNEVPLLFLCVVLAVWLERRGELAAALTVGALAFTVRGEGVLLIPIVLAYAVLRRRRRPRLAELVPAAIVLLLWAGFSWTYYRSVLPNTLAKKTVERYTSSFAAELPEIGWLISGIETQGVIFAGLLVLGAVCLLRRGDEFLAWMAVHVVSYSAIGAASHPWYYHSVGLVWALSAGAGTSWLLGRLVVGSLRSLQPWVALGFAAALLPACSVLTTPHQHERDRYSCYLEAARYLRPQLAPDETIAAMEIGVLGHELAPGQVLDTDFLVHRRPDGVAVGERLPYLITMHQPKFLVTVIVPTDRDEPRPDVKFGYPGRASVSFEMDQIIQSGGYQVAVYRRKGTG